MAQKGGNPGDKIVHMEEFFDVGTPVGVSEVGNSGGSSRIVETKKDFIEQILRFDKGIDFKKLISLLKGDDVVLFLSKQKEGGNDGVFFDFLDFLKQEYFGDNTPIPHDIVLSIRKNDVLKGHIILYIKERNHRVLSEQNMRQCEIISFHLFLLGMDQDFDLAQDIRVRKFAHTESMFSRYSLEIGKILGKLQLNAWGKSMDALNQKLDFYIELCETIIKLGVIHSVNLEERKIAFDLSSIIKGTTEVVAEELRKSRPQNTKIHTLEHTIGRSMVNFARGGVIIDGKTREEIKRQVMAVKQEQKKGFDKMVASKFGGDPAKEEIFSIVFLGEGTCIELVGLERIEEIYGELNSEEKQRKSELIDNLLDIYNSGTSTDIQTSTSAIDAFITKDHLGNEYQIETIYHIVCFDKSLDEATLNPLLYFLITKKEFSNALYEQFSIKIIERIIRMLTQLGGGKMPEARRLIHQTFIYLQGKSSSNFILGHSRIYLALAHYYIGLPDEASMNLAQEAYLHFVNLGSIKDGDLMRMRQKEQQFYALLGDRGLKHLGVTTTLSHEEKIKIGQKLYGDFADGYETRSIDTIRTEVLGLISALSTSEDVYSAKEINELIGQKIAEKLFDNLCTISIIGECKNCIHRGDDGEMLVCSDDKTQCKSRQMKKGYQAEYIDISNGLSIQFIYPVVSTHIFERMFAQKREMIKEHFENLIAANTKNETLTHLAFHDRETGLPNRNKLEEDLAGKERTIVFLEVADYDTILGLHGGRENWLELSQQIAQHFAGLSGVTLYRYNEKTFCLVFLPQSIERVGKNVGNKHIGKMITTILDGIVFEFSATYNRSLQFHTGIVVGQSQNHIKYAHIALTEAKNPRHHGPYIFKEGDEKKPEQTHYYTSVLEKAFDSNNKEYVIMPHYQRIYDPRNPHYKNIEALARIEMSLGNEPKQLVGAHNFIDIATSKKWLSKITQKMIEQIIDDMRQDPNLEVSINIHEQDWNDERIMAWFRWISKHSGIETKRMTIEILENVPLDRWDDLDADNKQIDSKDKQQVQELRELGYKIAIDDYGALGGSAEKIKKLKPDKIKLDRSVVRGLNYLEDKKESIAIIRHTVNMAREIGAEVIAEYVENKEIYEILLELGVDYFQGWYFAKAVPLGEVEWGELRKE